MSNFEHDIKKSISTLNNSGLILYPTDTVWGLGCDATDEAAIEKIFVLKDRPKEKSMIVLLAEAKDLFQYVAAPHPDIIDIVESFDTPTTVIYEGALGLPDNLVAEDGSIGIRVTNDPFCKALIKRLQKPLVSTSANLSGQPTPAFYNAINDVIKNGVDYVVEHRRDDNTPRQSSRIVRIQDDGSLQILRG
jgi:L-threonylcarbamoyladenylate synthase